MVTKRRVANLDLEALDRGRCVIRETWAHDDAVADEMEAIIEDAVVA